jgi:protein TonB
MPARVEILDERESIAGPLLRSLFLHLGVAGVVFAWSALNLGGRVERWGNPQSLGGGGVTITPVSGITLQPREGRTNPVANDTESRVPAPPKPQRPKAPAVDPAAVALKRKTAKAKAAEQAASQRRYTSVAKPKPHQVYSSTGQALTSPMFTQAPGGGGVGSGATGPFGQRFGWYEQLLRERVARNWQSQDLDARIRNKVAVTFEILRSGSIRNVRISQSSGNFALDQSAQRAILMSNPLPALPAGFERDSALIEFWFSLQTP